MTLPLSYRWYYTDCGVCLFDINEPNGAVILNCNHVMHKQCIVDNKNQLNIDVCPICNEKITRIHEVYSESYFDYLINLCLCV